MASRLRSATVRFPVVGPTLRALRSVAKLPDTLLELRSGLDSLAQRVARLEEEFGDLRGLLRDVEDNKAPLDFVAVRNLVESAPRELTSLRRDISQLRGLG